VGNDHIHEISGRSVLLAPSAPKVASIPITRCRLCSGSRLDASSPQWPLMRWSRCCRGTKDGQVDVGSRDG